MESRLVITVDGLNARFLGAYGNSWIPTPSINRLAAGGTLYENYLVNSNDPIHNFWGMITGNHPLLAQPDQRAASTKSLNDDRHRILVTDDADLESRVRFLFDETRFVQAEIADVEQHDTLTADIPENEEAELESESESSPLESLFQQTLDTLLEQFQKSEDQVKLEIWMHCRGFFGAWDAPAEIQELFKDDTDPEPIDIFAPPSITLQSDFDPDEKLAIVHAYAAMIVRLDECIGWLLSAVETLPSEPLIHLAGVRGFPLGEHLDIGGTSNCYSENVHVPLICTTPDRLPRRIRQMVECSDFSTCVETTTKVVAHENSGESDSDQLRYSSSQLIVSRSKNAARIQSPAWSYTSNNPPTADGTTDSTGFLYAKPADMMEVNAVADVCPEIAELLGAELLRQLGALDQGLMPESIELDSALFDGLA